MSHSSGELIDNLDHKETQERVDLLMKLFRFFNQCSYYADPKSGRRQGTWLLIFSFVLFPFFMAAVICLPDSFSAIFTGFSYALLVLLFDFFIAFIPIKYLVKIRKPWFVLKTPFFKSVYKRRLYAFYYYLLLLGMLLMPVILAMILDYFYYYGTSFLR